MADPNGKIELATTPGEELVKEGHTMRKMQTEFTTAVAIAKPRVRTTVLAACEEEAAIAGDEFYYSWSVKGKRGSSLVEGLSVHAALAAVRNWGNSAVTCDVREVGDHFIFTATFLDMETGFNLQRTFRQRKSQDTGMKDKERAEDIIYQIGQSKALRNVILNALPSWLTTKMIAKAKENIIAKIQKMGLDVAKQKTLAFFDGRGVDVERIEKKVGKKAERWNAEDLALLQGAMNTLLNGQESADSLFPETSEDIAVGTAKKTKKLKKDMEVKANPKSKDDLLSEIGKISDVDALATWGQDNAEHIENLSDEGKHIVRDILLARHDEIVEAQ